MFIKSKKNKKIKKTLSLCSTPIFVGMFPTMQF